MLQRKQTQKQAVDNQRLKQWTLCAAVNGLRHYDIANEADCVEKGEKKYEVTDQSLDESDYSTHDASLL